MSKKTTRNNLLSLPTNTRHSNASNFQYKNVFLAIFSFFMIPTAFAVDHPYEYIVTKDIKWQNLLQITWHPDSDPDDESGGHIVSGNEKLIFQNNATVTFDFEEYSGLSGAPTDTILQSIYYDRGFHSGPVVVKGIGTVKGHAGDIAITNYGIEDGQDLSSKITIEKSNFVIDNFSESLVHAEGGQVEFLNSQLINVVDTPYGFVTTANSIVKLDDIELFSMSNGQSLVEADQNSQISFNNTEIRLSNVSTAFHVYGNAKIIGNGGKISFSDLNSLIFAKAEEQASIEIAAEELSLKSQDKLAIAFGNSSISLSAEKNSNIEGTIFADALSANDQSLKANIELKLGTDKTSSLTLTKQNTNTWKGNAIAANQASISLKLGQNSYWEGRSDDFKDADSESGRQAHSGEFSDVVTELHSSGRIDLTLNEGSYWNVTGQSWVSKLGGQGTIDLRGSDTGGYALHIGELTGSNTFLVNLDKSNKAQSDMIYVYDGSGASEQKLLINNREEVLSSLKVGERVRFATVANASGGFVSDGLDTEINGGDIQTFGQKTQIRDAGVKNVNFKIVYEPYHIDQSTEADNLGYNGGEEFNEIKPGNEYVDAIYSEGENPYNVYIERAEDTVDITNPDDPSQNVTDAGRTIIDMSRANYANAVQMDTLNKRQGEMRYSQGREDGLWVRVRHDDIGKKSSFRLDNTMIEVGVDSRYVKEDGEFHTGIAFDYMNGDTEYHHISGRGDLDRYGAWMYLTWLGNQGDYSDFVFKFGHLESDFKIWAATTGEQIRGDYDNDVFLVSYEKGRKFQNEEKWFIEPQAQLQYAYVTSDEYQTSQGTNVRLDGIHSLIGRVGVRIGKDSVRNNPLTFYARGDIMHEFMGDQDIKAKDNTGAMHIRYDNDDTWYSTGVGLTYVQDKDTAVFFEAEKVFGASNTSSYILSGGVRFLFN